MTDEDSIVSISSNEFTLAAGAYLIHWSAPGYQVNVHVTRLYDVTNSAVIQYGTSAFSHDQNSTTNRSFGWARVAPSGSTAYKLEHRCSNTVTDSGFGERSSFGNINIYAEILILKES